MKDLNEKLILAITAVLFVAGLAFFVLFPSNKEISVKSPKSEKRFSTVAIESFESTQADWPEASEQAKGEMYDLFTPPEIYINALGEFVFRPPYFVSSDDPFGVTLLDVNRNPYRFQLEGFVEEDRADQTKTIILLHSVEDGYSLRLSPNDSNSQYGFNLLDWNIERETDENGNYSVVAKLKLKDTQSGEVVHLTHNEDYYEEKISVVLSFDETNEQYLLEGVGANFFVGDIEYRLDAVDAENDTVVVTKLIPDNDPITELLVIADAASISDDSDDQSDSFETEDVFDSFF